MPQIFPIKPTLAEAQDMVAIAIVSAIQKSNSDAELQKNLYSAIESVLCQLECTYQCWSGNSHQAAQALSDPSVPTHKISKYAKERIAKTWITEKSRDFNIEVGSTLWT